MIIGDRFSTADELKKEFRKYAHKNNFSFGIERSESKKIFLKCVAPGCKNIARFYLSRDYLIKEKIVFNNELRSWILDHTCNCRDPLNRNCKIDTKFIKREFQNLILNNISITIDTLRVVLQDRTSYILSYQVYRIKE